ncbi:MAG: hypothetical protein RLY70_615 [Planctomycetota bacterium]|jgi:hypothetical protein
MGFVKHGNTPRGRWGCNSCFGCGDPNCPAEQRVKCVANHLAWEIFRISEPLWWKDPASFPLA